MYASKGLSGHIRSCSQAPTPGADILGVRVNFSATDCFNSIVKNPCGSVIMLIVVWFIASFLYDHTILPIKERLEKQAMDVAVKVFTTAYTVNKQAKAGAKAANIGTSADD